MSDVYDKTQDQDRKETRIHLLVFFHRDAERCFQFVDHIRNEGPCQMAKVGNYQQQTGILMTIDLSELYS